MALAAVGTTPASGAASLLGTAQRAADPFAKAMHAAGEMVSSLAEKSGPAARADELRQSSTLKLAEFKRSLKQQLAAAGIDTSQQIRLELDDTGRVNVAGQHADRDKIEQIFADNPDLAAKFQALAQQYGELRTLENPPTGTDSLFPPVFGLSIVNDEIDVAFQ